MKAHPNEPFVPPICRYIKTKTALGSSSDAMVAMVDAMVDATVGAIG